MRLQPDQHEPARIREPDHLTNMHPPFRADRPELSPGRRNSHHMTHTARISAHREQFSIGRPCQSKTRESFWRHALCKIPLQSGIDIPEKQTVSLAGSPPDESEILAVRREGDRGIDAARDLSRLPAQCGHLEQPGRLSRAVPQYVVDVIPVA